MLMSFNKCMNCATTTPYNDTEHFQHPRKTPQKYHSPVNIDTLETTLALMPVTIIIIPMLELHVNGIIQHITFSSGFLLNKCKVFDILPSYVSQ
jgi:hypothetical protein